MKRRIFLNMCALAFVILFFASGLFLLSFYRFFNGQMRDEVKEKAIIIAEGLKSTTEDEAFLSSLKLNETNNRLTLIEKDGNVLYDSYTTSGALENHLNRPEIIEAFNKGYGEAVRFSSTLKEETYYYSLLLNEDTVLRLSSTTNSIYTLFGGVLPYIFLIVVGVFGSCLVIAFLLTKKITDPINKINLDKPQEAVEYDELAPLYRRIEEQNKQIREQLKDLESQRDKISLILENMKEGIMLLDNKGIILTINKSLLRIMKVPEGSFEGKSFLELTRKLSLSEGVKEALEGSYNDGDVLLEGKNYHYFISPVYDENTITGAMMLFVDVTEKRKAEKIRREFSANVSHELKTPLTSISGYAEMISTGMAGYDDSKLFASKIQTEAGRLIGLISDIMKLSQLEEGNSYKDFQEINLLEIIEVVTERLEPQLKERELKLSIEGQDTFINGNKMMLEELVFNLCENAIKYNEEEGSISISIKELKDKVTLEVRDSGIGIPKEHHERIFERFYRVDKSHSKKTGGTGLGLAIVKHIAEYHKGSVTVESEEGIGTSIKVEFSKALP